MAAWAGMKRPLAKIKKSAPFSSVCHSACDQQDEHREVTVPVSQPADIRAGEDRDGAADQVNKEEMLLRESYVPHQIGRKIRDNHEVTQHADHHQRDAVPRIAVLQQGEEVFPVIRAALQMAPHRRQDPGQ